MKKVIIAVILACSAAAFTQAADKPLGLEEFTSVEELAGAIAADFPKVQGEVNEVKGDRVTLTLGRKDGLTPGMTLILWRVAKEILHPLTNAVIGRTEEEVGTVEVSSASETSSIAVIVKKSKDPRPGDKARITPRKIGLAVVPAKGEATDFITELAKALGEGGRFSVLDAEKTATFLKERKVHDADMVVQMGHLFSLDAVVAVSQFAVEGKLLVTARVFYADDGRLLDTIAASITKRAGSESLGTVKPFFAPAAIPAGAPVREERAVSQDLPLLAQLFVRADLDGDGAPEYAFADGTRLQVFRQEPAGWKELWSEVRKGAGTVDVQHAAISGAAITDAQVLSLDAADINRNGRPELFLTEIVRDKVVTTVTEWKDGAYRRIAEVPAFLRVVSMPGRKPFLIGLAFDLAHFYTGEPKEYSWSGSAYVPGAAFPLPSGVRLYGFSYADFGEGRSLLVALTDDDRLAVYSGDSMIWKSEEAYAGRSVTVLRPMTLAESMTTRSVAMDPSGSTKNREVRIAGRVIVFDLDGDGRQEVLVSKGSGGGLLSIEFSRKSDVRALRWTGVRLEDRWSVRDIAGDILDLQAERQGGSTEVRALLRSSNGVLKKDSEQVMLYTVK